MNVWHQIASYIAPGWHYRQTCPDTVETCAQHFINNYLHPAIRTLDFDQVDENDPWFACRRRISYNYGVSTSYQDPRGKKGLRGWNRRLWRNYPEDDPEELVERIFNRMIEILRAKKR